MGCRRQDCRLDCRLGFRLGFRPGFRPGFRIGFRLGFGGSFLINPVIRVWHSRSSKVNKSLNISNLKISFSICDIIEIIYKYELSKLFSFWIFFKELIEFIICNFLKVFEF